VDFVDWCGLVLSKLIEATDASPETRSIGIDQYYLSRTLFGYEFTNRPEFQTSTYLSGMFDALGELEKVNLIESRSSSSLWKVTRLGRELIQDKDMTPLWQSICQERLGPEEEQLLKTVNRLSAHTEQDHAWLENINHEPILAELGWVNDVNSLVPLSQELEQTGLIGCIRYLGPRIQFQATYSGLVWKTRRGFTLMSKFIDELVAEWETTNVDFKRVLNVNTADEKAEFIKDVLSLVNTKTSGQRWMIIGFDDKTRTYYGPPDKSLTQNRFEQLLPVYTKPYVTVRYEVVDYREGQVGMLEILREPKKVPYSVAKSIGHKKRIEQDDVYVRHGSQVEKPTPLELQALHDEGDQARANNP